MQMNITLCVLTLCFYVSGLQAASKPIDQEVKIYRNLRYADKPVAYSDTSSDRTLDLYLPVSKGNSSIPVVMFIHGGGFSGGDKKSMETLCKKLSAFGYAVVSINYRLYLKQNKISGASCSANMSKGLRASFNPGLETAISTASEDAILALAWIREKAAVYPFDLSDVAISGGSAGAMTALYTAYVSGQKILPIKAVVNLWGGLESTAFIKKDAPALLTYHGDQDKLIHIDYGHALKNRMDEVGNTRSRLVVMEGMGHARYDYIAKEKVEEIASFLKNNN